MRPGAFLRVTRGVVGNVTWGLNIALCCWGWRTWKQEHSNVDTISSVTCSLYFFSSVMKDFKLRWTDTCQIKGQFTGEGACPGLLMPGWSWGLLTGAVRRGARLLTTTVVAEDEAEETGPEAGWGTWLCWMKASESGVSCLNVGRLRYRPETGGQTLKEFITCGCKKWDPTLYIDLQLKWKQSSYILTLRKGTR